NDGEGAEGFQQGDHQSGRAGRHSLSAPACVAAARSGADPGSSPGAGSKLMASRLPFIAIIAAVLLFLAWSSIFVVNAGQQAIVLRFGEIVDVKTEPGIYF